KALERDACRVLPCLPRLVQFRAAATGAEILVLCRRVPGAGRARAGGGEARDCRRERSTDGSSESGRNQLGNRTENAGCCKRLKDSLAGTRDAKDWRKVEDRWANTSWWDSEDFWGRLRDFGWAATSAQSLAHDSPTALS